MNWNLKFVIESRKNRAPSISSDDIKSNICNINSLSVLQLNVSWAWSHCKKNANFWNIPSQRLHPAEPIFVWRISLTSFWCLFYLFYISAACTHLIRTSNYRIELYISEGKWNSSRQEYSLLFQTYDLPSLHF